MNFFRSIIDWLRNIRASVTTGFHKTYPIGAIVSGSYTNFKHDPTPTILYLGNYQNPKNRKFYIHGLQLHYMSEFDKTWLLKLIYMMKRGSQVVNPRQFYYYIKINRPDIIKKCYRIYHSEFTNFYTISPGFSNMNVKSCYSVKDARDYQITQLNQMINASYNPTTKDYTSPAKIAYSQDELQEHIQMVLNTHKII